MHIQIGARAEQSLVDAVFQMLAAFFIAARDGVGDVLNIHIFRITDDIVDFLAHTAGGADVIGTEQAADTAGERHQHRHRILDQPGPIAATLRQGLGQPVDGVGQRRQRAEKQQHARHRQAGGQRRALELFARRPYLRLLRSRMGGCRLRLRLGGGIVDGAELGIVHRLCTGCRAVPGRLAGLLFKAAEPAVFHGGVQADKHQTQRPPHHKRNDNGPPRELERPVPGVVFVFVGIFRIFIIVGHG